MPDCQEPTGIGVQDNVLFCGDASVAECGCGLNVCQFHLDIHEHRHKILGNLGNYPVREHSNKRVRRKHKVVKSARDSEAETSENDMKTDAEKVTPSLYTDQVDRSTEEGTDGSREDRGDRDQWSPASPGVDAVA